VASDVIASPTAGVGAMRIGGRSGGGVSEQVGRGTKFRSTGSHTAHALREWLASQLSGQGDRADRRVGRLRGRRHGGGNRSI
jgi:hypothetical protein